MYEIQLLTEAECRDVVRKLWSVHEYWVPRDGRGNFLTLGWATYLDGSLLDDDGVRDGWAESNRMLYGLFQAELERVRAAIEQWTGQKVVYQKDVPLPGFHVWLSQGIPTQPSASVHFDLQYEPLVRHGVLPAPEDTLSFTLPVALPMTGGGLTYWKDVLLGVSDIDWSGGKTLADVTRDAASSHIEYSLGKLVLHSGQLAHQISPVPVVRPDDLRITMQGHALLSQSRWILYW